MRMAILAALLAGCSSPLYAPCERQADCAEGLRCVNLGGDYGALCTRACTISKERAGHPEALDDDALFEDGTTQLKEVADAQCSEGPVKVGSQDVEGGPEQDVSVEGEIVGVCRVSQEQLANPRISGDSQLSGFCVPL